MEADRANAGRNSGCFHTGRYCGHVQSRGRDVVKSSAGGGSAGNPAGHAAGNPESQLERDQYWINLEAFATSSRGLGLNPKTWWWLSWRELEAHRLLWARDRADFHNASFSTEGTPFLPEDFLGTGNREGRKADAMISKANAEMANVQLQQTVKPGQEEGIPDWAKGAYRAK